LKSFMLAVDEDEGTSTMRPACPWLEGGKGFWVKYDAVHRSQSVTTQADAVDPVLPACPLPRLEHRLKKYPRFETPACRGIVGKTAKGANYGLMTRNSPRERRRRGVGERNKVNGGTRGARLGWRLV
jgi:hypothetical protein